MIRKLFLPEVFAELAKAETFEDQVTLMKQQHSLALLQLCNYAWNPDCEFDVEIPEIKKDTRPIGFSGINLFSEIRRMYIFTKKHSPATPKKKKQLLYTLLMELDSTEAKLIVDLLTGEIRNYPNFTRELVSTLYPLIPLPEVVENKADADLLDRSESITNTVANRPKSIKKPKNAKPKKQPVG